MPDKDGVTRYETLKRAEKRLKRRPKELDGPRLPHALRYVWKWFKELDKARQVGDFSVQKIGYEQIGWWTVVTGKVPTPYEAELLIELDQVYRKIINDDRHRKDNAVSAGRRNRGH